MPTPSPQSRSYGKLLQAVTALLDERDPAHVAITDIVARAGVTRPTFYACFDDLPTAFAAAAVARIAAALHGEAVPDAPVETRRDVMQQAIARMLERIAPHAEFFRRVLLGHGGHLVQARVIALIASEIRTNTPVSAALARGPLPIETASTAIAAGISWTMLTWFSSSPRIPVQALALALRDLVYHSIVGGLGAAPSSPRSPP